MKYYPRPFLKDELLFDSFKYYLSNYFKQVSESMIRETQFFNILKKIISISLAPLNNTNKKDQIKLFVYFYSKSLKDARFQKIINETYNTYMEQLQLLIKYGIKQKQIPSIDTKETAISIISFIEGIILHYLIGFRPITISKLSDLCFRQLKKIIKGGE